jgi:hypothetical protein
MEKSVFGSVLQLLRDQNLETRINAGRSGSAEAPQEPHELAEVAAAGAEPRDFQKDVRSWNPQLPTWRRGPKP